MKNSLFIIVLFIAILQPVFAQSQSDLRVLTFNIWDPGDYPWWEKHAGGYPVEDIVNYLTEDKADILLLQEVTLEKEQDNQAFFKIKKELENKGYLYAAFYRPDYSKGVGTIGYIKGMKNSGYPLAIFSKYPILETYAIQTLHKKTMSKGVLGVKVQFNKAPLFVFNTHLSIGSPFTDEEVKKVALPFVNSIVGGDAVIFGGDWNSPPAIDYPNSGKTIGKYYYSSKTAQPLLDAGFVDVYPIAAIDRSIEKDATCPGQDDYIKRVDRIYQRNTKLIPVKAWVKGNPWESIKLKDHKGVLIEFKVEN